MFLEANRVVRRPSIYDNAWGSADEVEAYAKRYKEDVTNKTLVLINHEHQKIEYLPYKTRFDDEYAKRIARKWKKVGYTEGIFLTLTLNPNRFSSLHQAYTGMIEGWNKIVTAIRKRYPNFIGYVRVVEFQKSGNPHLHIMLFGVDFVPVEWIRELWENHYGFGNSN
ncbi:MAG: protein rep [Sulfolobales archaeon]|nr:protein rep [Sulfolobales archaeon]